MNESSPMSKPCDFSRTVFLYMNSREGRIRQDEVDEFKFNEEATYGYCYSSNNKRIGMESAKYLIFVNIIKSRK